MKKIIFNAIVLAVTLLCAPTSVSGQSIFPSPLIKDSIAYLVLPTVTGTDTITLGDFKIVKVNDTTIYIDRQCAWFIALKSTGYRIGVKNTVLTAGEFSTDTNVFEQLINN